MALAKTLSGALCRQRSLSRNVLLAGILNRAAGNSRSLSSALAESYYNEEQKEMQATVKRIIDAEINPVRKTFALKLNWIINIIMLIVTQYVEKWEEENRWPAHEVLKKLGNAGLLGIDKPVEYGGLGLDWKYNCAVLGTGDKLCVFT